MNLVLSAPAAFTPLALTNLQAGLSTSSLSSLASSHSTGSSTTASASASSSPVLFSRHLSLEQIVAAAQLHSHSSLGRALQQPPPVKLAMSQAAAASMAAPSLHLSSTSSSSPSSAVSVASSPSSPAGKSSSSSSAPSNDVHKRIRATKNKQKHNESESRRRDRLRTQFNALRLASECDKKDRIAILAAATDRLRQQNQRVRQYEAERELLIQQLNQASQANLQLSRAQLAAASSASTSTGGLGVSMLGKDGNVGDVGKLAAGQVGWLASLPCAFVGLDGKFLDCNAAFVALTGHSLDFILASTIFVLTPQHELTPTFMQLKRLLAGEIDSWESDRSCLCADGNAMHVHMTMTVAKSREGKPEFFTLFFGSKADGATAAHAAAAAANGMATVNGGQQQHQSTLQLLQPTGLRPPTGGSMSLLSLPSTSNLSLLASQQSPLPNHPHASPLSHHHMNAAGLGLATLQSLPQQQPQHRYDAFQPTFAMQQHM